MKAKLYLADVANNEQFNRKTRNLAGRVKDVINEYVTLDMCRQEFVERQLRAAAIHAQDEYQIRILELSLLSAINSFK